MQIIWNLMCVSWSTDLPMFSSV